MDRSWSANCERGSASVEQAGLVALVAAIALSSIALLIERGETRAGAGLAGAVADKIACAPVMRAPCTQDPLTTAYGRSLAGAVRALAPATSAVVSGSGLALVGVDFRRCRRESCAVPLAGERGERLTQSNRRTTAFVSVEDQRRKAGGGAEISYWIYRPSLGWERQVVRPSSAEINALAPTPLLESDNPALVPLETLPGRNHFDFPDGEEPPWRWLIIG